MEYETDLRREGIDASVILGSIYTASALFTLALAG